MDLPKYAFFQGKIVPYSEAKVGVLTHGLNYGTAAFGGIRAYWNEPEQQLYLFRPIEHYTRFLNSTKILLMNLGQSPESLLKITLELLALEQYRRDIYIRPLAYKADESIGVKLHGIKDELSIVAIPSIKYFGDKEGIHVTISSWRRVDDNVIPARGKIAGALQHRPGSVAQVYAHLARDDLRQRGFAQTGRTEQQHMVERLFAPLRRLDEYLQLSAYLLLANILVELLGA